VSTDLESGRDDTAVTDLLNAPAEAHGRFAALAWRIGEEVAGPHADEVDAEARFPREAIDAVRESGLLAALIPADLGGGGARLSEVAAAVRALSAHCTSSGLVLAMHSIEIFNLVRYGSTPHLRAMLGEVVARGLLFANANSEVGLGGDVSRSRCALEERGDLLHLDKECLAISFGAYADVISATSRVNPEAAETDRVTTLFRQDDVTLTETSPWVTMGLRGTCSAGYSFSGDAPADAVYPVPFAEVANNGGMQATQILLSSAWVGLAEGVMARAHTFVRAAARRNIGVVPPTAVRLSELATRLQASRSLLAGAALRFEAADRAGSVQDAGVVADLRALKVSTSRLAAEIATAAVELCGMAAFRRDTPFAMDRLVRDAHGGLVMVSNDRYLQDNAQLLVARKSL
jgi:acyl-CoA dehydrogenase